MADLQTAPATERELEQYRAQLTGYCYRMMGSAFEAEDAVQETMLRAWRNLDQFEGRAAMKSWLYRIATNVCLTMLDGRKRRARPMDIGGPGDAADPKLGTLPEATWLEPMPDGRILAEEEDPEEQAIQRETLRLAFVAALQHLPARQRAVLILRDVLGFSARETATALETTSVSVDSALQRAHKTVDQRLPDQSQQATLRSLTDGALRQVAQRYITAWERNDVGAVVAMLAEDAKLAMPPLPGWYHGRGPVAAFLGSGPMSGATRWRLIPARANGQLAFALYGWNDGTQTFVPRAVDILTLRGAQILEITAFLTPDAFRRFSLPASLPESAASS
jgi:RNA polymerase sigma-70 factor (ECF subfamily)